MLPSVAVFPSSFGEPTNNELSVIQTPRPKSSFADAVVDDNLSSIINFVLYIVAVNAPPDSVALSIMFVSCRSKVVWPKSNFISLELAKFSEPITNLVP